MLTCGLDSLNALVTRGINSISFRLLDSKFISSLKTFKLDKVTLIGGYRHLLQRLFISKSKMFRSFKNSNSK